MLSFDSCVLSLFRDLNLNNLAEDSNHLMLRDETSNERFALYYAGDIIKPNTQPHIPVAQGKKRLCLFRFNSMGSPQARPDIMTEAEIHKLTLGKRRWIQPASPTEKGPEGCNQHEPTPVKKISFSQLTLPTINCHPASEEECQSIHNVNKQSKNGQIDQFWNCRSGLTEKDNCDSVCEEISKEVRADKAVFIQVQHNGFISNAEKPTYKFQDLETSHCRQDNLNSELSAPVESCAYVKRCGSISVFECEQDTPVRPGEILGSVREKEDSDSERREITKSRTSKYSA